MSATSVGQIGLDLVVNKNQFESQMTGITGIVYLTDIALLYLKRYLEKRKDSSVALFAGKGTPRLTKGGIETLLKRIGNVAGVENVHPHRFRRTLATNLLDRGMSIQDVAVILGHADLKTTQIYCFINQSNVKNAYRKYAA